MSCNLLIFNVFYFLKPLIILWSQVRALVGPPKVRKPLISASGFFLLDNSSILSQITSKFWTIHVATMYSTLVGLDVRILALCHAMLVPPIYKS